MKKKKRRSSGNDSEKIISDNEFDDDTEYNRRKSIDERHMEEDRYAHSRRDPSPELARISALVTHPPKQKQSSRSKLSDIQINNEYIFPPYNNSPPAHIKVTYVKFHFMHIPIT